MSGGSNGGREHDCPICRGTGVKGGHGDLRDCPACKGTGELVEIETRTPETELNATLGAARLAGWGRRG